MSVTDSPVPDRRFAPLRIDMTESGIAIRGEIDAMTAPQFAEILRHYRSVQEIDMTGITFFASAGARELETWATKPTARAQVVLSAPIKRVLDLIAAEDLFAEV